MKGVLSCVMLNILVLVLATIHVHIHTYMCTQVHHEIIYSLLD
jgi:hypothetical protein